MDSEYLIKHVGLALSLGLTDICQKKPNDPIEYLSEWLLKYIDNTKHQKLMEEERKERIRTRELAKEEKKRLEQEKEKDDEGMDEEQTNEEVADTEVKDDSGNQQQKPVKYADDAIIEEPEND